MMFNKLKVGHTTNVSWKTRRLAAFGQVDNASPFKEKKNNSNIVELNKKGSTLYDLKEK